MTGYMFTVFVVVITFQNFLTEAQLPPRLNIPGALLIQPNRPQLSKQQRLHNQDAPIPLRVRKPIPNALPISIPIREVSDEESRSSILDDEVSRLSISALQSSLKQGPNEESESPRPVQFRPERPIPILRQDLRESGGPQIRPIIRQDLDDEPPIPRQPIRQPAPQIARQHIPPPQPIRQKPRPNPRPAPQQEYIVDEDGRRVRNRKPPVQILRKYRTDNDDGSITWGFENEDGTFKEETIGADCIIRGKYGYIDPEGTRREYSYETGNKCDQPEEEYPIESLPSQQQALPNRSPAKKISLKI